MKREHFLNGIVNDHVDDRKVACSVEKMSNSQTVPSCSVKIIMGD
jgi:hypothetical protein